MAQRSGLRTSVQFRFGSRLFKSCVVCGHCRVTVPHKQRNIKMVVIAAHLSASHSGGDSAALGSLPLPPTSCDLGPRQYAFGDNSALNKFNQPIFRVSLPVHNTKAEILPLCYLCLHSCIPSQQICPHHRCRNAAPVLPIFLPDASQVLSGTKAKTLPLCYHA